MSLRNVLQSKRDEILKIAASHGAYNVRVFGSVVRGDDDDASDVDFLVDLKDDRNLLDLAGMLMDLRDLLGRDVDVVTPDGLRARLRDRVLSEARPV